MKAQSSADYHKVVDNDPDLGLEALLPDNGNDLGYYDNKMPVNYKRLLAVLVLISALMFIFVVTIALNKSENDVGHHQIKGGKHKPRNIKPERVILDNKYLRITDCGKSSKPFNVEYFQFSELPINLYTNTTLNSRFIMKEGLSWTTELELEIEKLLFGLDWLNIKLPCFMDYFGSCRFNFCEMHRIHWDEQICQYIEDHYVASCQCPYIFRPGVFELKDAHYKPVVARILKYFSWLAEGWYNMKIKLYKNKASRRPYLCVRVHGYIDTEEKDAS